MNKRYVEMLAMLIIGDGMLTALQPKRHCLLWEVGPKAWRELIEKFTEHPEISRLFGAAQAAAGFWLASRQEPGLRERLGRL